MKNYKKNVFLILLCLAASTASFGQDADSLNIKTLNEKWISEVSYITDTLRESQIAVPDSISQKFQQVILSRHPYPAQRQSINKKRK
jgi:hypothetical protein